MTNFFDRGQNLIMTYVVPFVYKPGLSIPLNKSVYVESLRGLAIILVVLGHIIGVNTVEGMRVADDSIFRYIYFSLEYIRMPLFTVISGWVYASKPVIPGEKKSFIKGKLQRLLLPMIVVSALLYLMRMVIPGTNTTPELSRMAYILVFPYDVFWFLYSLFLIFLFIAVLDSQPWFKTSTGWAATLVCLFLLQFLVREYLTAIPNYFGVKGAFYLFPFFMVGVGIYRFRQIILTDHIAGILLLIFFAGIVFQQLTWFGYFPIQEKNTLLGMSVGISAALLLFKLKPQNAFLVWIGSYAYSIFLFHVFFTGGTRIVLLKAGIGNPWVILFAGLVLSILIPIVIENFLVRSKVLRLVFLGRR
jgi:glucans biosynthesis protein C